MTFPLQLDFFSVPGFFIPFYVPEKEMVKAAFQRGQIAYPYWSQIWPAAKALASFLVLHPEYTKDKNVLELGGGLGLPSLVAAHNAAFVLCTDIEPEAMAVVDRSVAHLQLKNISTAVLDWQQLLLSQHVDVLLLSDINYEPAAFDTLLTLVKAFIVKGTLVLLSTPQRLVAKNFITPLVPYCTIQEEIAVAHEGEKVMTSVMVLKAFQAS